MEQASQPGSLSLHVDFPFTQDGSVGSRHRKLKRSMLRARWAVLSLSCLAMTGVYFSYDIPAALHQQLLDYMPPTDRFEVRFNLLYTVYSLPNVILPFFGGNFVDRMGSPRCMVAFASLTLLGQLIFTIGTEAKSWGVMLLGRTFYGFGGESICVAQSTMLSQWFGGEEVALAFGVSLAVSRLGSVFNNLVSPFVANSVSTPFALWVGVIVNAASVCAGVAIGYIDRKASRKCRSQNDATALLTVSLLEDDAHTYGDDGDKLQQNGSVTSRGSDGEEEAAPVRLSDVRRLGVVFWLLSLSCFVVYGCVLPFNNVASGILLERNYFTRPPDDCTLSHPDQCTSGTLQNSTNPSTNKNGNVCPSKNSAPVLPTTINFTRSDNSWEEQEYVYDSLTPRDVDCGDPFWADACTSDYCSAQHRATERSGRIMSIPYFISAGLSPFLGHFVDKVGMRAVIACIAPLTLIFVHATLAASTRSPVVPLIGQGIAYSFFAAVLWPSVPLTVEAKLTGTAFGVITSIQNIGLALFPLIIAGIYNVDGGHYIPNVEYFFVSCAVCGLLVGVALNIMDSKRGGKLNSVHSSNDEDAHSLTPISSLVPSEEASYIS